MAQFFLEKTQKLSESILEANGYNKTFDNKDIPHDEKEDLTAHAIYSNGKNQIKISAQDWRDFYFIYFIELNGKKVVEVNYINNIDGALKILVETIKSIVNP
ncbi:MAG: hypothetical protein CL840_21115 [Crocinitomicaceae bacterium]|nr:hypothetical protein [Crocinitomicaceae bacterium]|tara:strand:- start:16808 stop:17113 length:306 start_codon:yes stop_codon:yes gene_type:complete